MFLLHRHALVRYVLPNKTKRKQEELLCLSAMNRSSSNLINLVVEVVN